MSPLNSYASGPVSKIRAKAQSLKEKKNVLASNVLKKIVSTSNIFSSCASICKSATEVMSAGATFTKELVSDNVLREMTSTMVSNCVVDVANRANEVANILEASSKNNAITNAVIEVDRVLVRIKRIMEANKKPGGSFESKEIDEETFTKIAALKSAINNKL